GPVGGLPPDHQVAAGQLLADPAQVQPGEHHLGARGADVHPDARQRDVVLLPDRVVLDRTEGLVVVVAVVVVVVVEVVVPVPVVMVVVAHTEAAFGGRVASSAS